MHSFGYSLEGYNHGPLQLDVVNGHWLTHGPADYVGFVDLGHTEPSDVYSVVYGEERDRATPIDDPVRAEVVASLALLIHKDTNYHI